MSVEMGESTVPTPVAEAPREHFRSLDGFRAFAALAVLLAHVGLLSGLNVRNAALGPYLARADVGVSIFFLLSGFLLYRPFVAARFAGRPAGALGAYARRRALRILPAYWVALTVVAFVLRAPPFEDGHSIPLHYLLLHIYDPRHLAGGGFQITGGPVQQSWSLATEISFYAFLPAYAWLLARRRRSPARQLRAELIGLAGLWVGAVTLKLACLASDMSTEHFGLINAWLPLRLDEFALGMGMAVGSAWVAHRRITLPAWATGLAATLASWTVAALLFWVTCIELDMPLGPLFTSRQAFVVRLLYAFTALFLLLPAVFGRKERSLTSALFANPVMVWLGLVSYGIYIWHEAWQAIFLRRFDHQAFRAPFWQMLGFAGACTLACATASWYLVERTALRHKSPR